MDDAFVINLLNDHPDWAAAAIRFEDAVLCVVRHAGSRFAPGRRLQSSRRGEQVEFGPFPSPDGEPLWARGRRPEDLARSLRELLGEVPALVR